VGEDQSPGSGQPEGGHHALEERPVVLLDANGAALEQIDEFREKAVRIVNVDVEKRERGLAR
jgi:hypothetical protein